MPPNATVCYLSSKLLAQKNDVTDYLDATDEDNRERMVRMSVSLGRRQRPRNRTKRADVKKVLSNRRTEAGEMETSQKKKSKGLVLYSAVSSPLDRSKRFTLSSPDRPVHSDTVLGFSWKHSSHAAIAQRLFTHISTTVYSQILIYTAETTEAS